LPGGVQQLGDSSLQSFLGVRDDKLDAAKATLPQLTEKGRPERLCFGRADVHAQHLAAAVAVGPDRDDHRHRDDPAILANLQVGGVDPEIRPLAFERAIQEGRDPLVDLFAEPADLALEMPVIPMALTSSSTERVETPWM
jgi:hypothetical protein